MHRLGLLTTLDVATFSVYCETFAGWRQAEELLAQQAERDPASRALTIKTNTGSAMQNPLLRVAITAASDTVRFAAEFGLAPAARSRVAGSLTARMAPSKFDGLLGP